MNVIPYPDIQKIGVQIAQSSATLTVSVINHDGSE
jgi:hypothetical protein